MIVGNCRDEDHLKADSSDLWFDDECGPDVLEALQELISIVDSIADGTRPWADIDSFTAQPGKAAIAKCI